MKGKGERERYTQLNEDFQRVARGDRKAFLSEHCKEIEGHNIKGTSAAAAAKSLQSCLTLCDPIDGSPPGSPVPGILQARTLEWVAVSFSDA